MKTQRIRTNGIEIYVEEHSTAGEPIVLLHYQNGSAAIWHDVIPYFADTYRVIALDLRGFGYSDQPEGGYDMDTMADDVRGVLDALAISRAHFVGNSLGGYVSTYLAAKHPERVLSLTNAEAALQNQGGLNGRFDFSKEELLSRINANPLPTYANREEFERAAREQWLPWNAARAAATASNADVLRETADGRVTYKQTHAMRLAIAEDLWDRDFGDWYRNIQCPVLFLPCELEDGLDKKLRSIESFSATLPYSKTVVIPNSTHMMTFDHAVELAAEVSAFLSEIK